MEPDPEAETASEPVASILEEPPAFIARALVYLIAALTIVALVWAWFSQVEVVILGKGYLAPYGLSKIVNAETSGMVKEILVQEGRRVEKGEVLMRLDALRSTESLKKTRDQIQAQRETLRSSASDMRFASRELARAQKEYGLQKQLAEEGLSPAVRTLEYERQVDQAKAQLQQANLKRLTTLGSIRQLQDDLRVEERNLRGFDIRSPVAGIVTEIKIRGAQEFVQSGQVLANVAPQGEAPLIAKVQVDNKDSGHLKAGLPAKIKVDAYPFQDYGMLSGKVLEVSPDAREREKGGGAYYEAILSLDGDSLKFGKRSVRVRRGQTLTGEIVVDRMPLLMILLRPFRHLGDRWSIASD